MKRNSMYFDTQKVKVYRASYRPSSNLYRLLKTVLSVIVDGQSPMGSSHFYYGKKKR